MNPPAALRRTVLVVWAVASLGCSQDEGPDFDNIPLAAPSHAHHHLHASDVKHDHVHGAFDAGAHSHLHDHTDEPATDEPATTESRVTN